MKTKELTAHLKELNLKPEIVIEMLAAHAEKLEENIADLKRWKAEAIIVLNEWDKTWVAAGMPGVLGSSRAKATKEYILKNKQ